MQAAFGFVEQLSPWWWVALALFLGVIEMLTMTAFLLWPALAALCMALLQWMVPGIPGEIQVTLFAALAIAMTILGKRVLLRGENRAQEASPLNQRARRVVGRSGRVIDWRGRVGTVDIEGVQWEARRVEGEGPLDIGAEIEVTDIDGMVVLVRTAQ